MDDQPGAASAVEFLKKFHPASPWLLSRIARGGRAAPCMEAVDDVAAFLGRHGPGCNLYFNPAILSRDFDVARGKPTEADVAGSRAAWAEIDPRDPDRADWDAIRAECLAPLLRVRPEPSMIVYSGRGCWGYWLLDAPASAAETKAMNLWLQGALRALAGPTVKVDSVANADRLARLPGSINHRSGRRAEVVADTGVVYSAADIGRAAPPRAAVEVALGEPLRIDSSDALDAHVDPRLHEQARYQRLKVLMLHGHDPADPRKDDAGGDGSGSGWTFDFAANALRAGVAPELIVGILTDERHAISRHCRAQRNALRAAERAVQNATREGARLGEWLDGMVVADGMVELSEDHLAHIFVTRHPDLRYCATGGAWYEWAETRWRQDSTLHVFGQARQVAREASLLAGSRKHASKLASASTVAAIEKLARADRRAVVAAESFDADPMLLNTPGGVVDLRTGATLPHSRDLFQTKTTRVAPESGRPENFIEFLRTVTGDDAEYIAYLRRMCGYMLTGLTVEHALFFAHGGGGNGKSVLQETMLHVLHEYAKTTSFNTLIAHSGGPQHPTDLAALRGARLVVAPETEANQRWAEAKIKSMTGGDRITARFMRQDFFEYTPQFKLFVVGNHRPSFSNVDDAIRRRVHLLPFGVRIARPDKHFKEHRLFPEAGRILGWAIEGCLEWQAMDGLHPPPRVASATEEYLVEQDTVGRWLVECTVRAPDASARVAELFESWSRWCAESNEPKGSKRALGTLLSDRGYPREKGAGNVAAHRGLRLAPEEAQRLATAARARAARAEQDRVIAGLTADEARRLRDAGVDGDGAEVPF